MSMLKRTAVLFIAVSALATGAYAQSAGVFLRIGGDPTDSRGFARISDFGLSRGLLEEVTPFQNFRYKRPGRAKYNNIVLKRGFAANDGLDTWIDEVCQGSSQRKSVSIIAYGRERSEVARYSMPEALPTRITFPACDTRVFVPRDIEVELSSLSTATREQFSGFKNGDVPNQEQKKWTPANFRLRIEGLDAACSRVNKIEAITIKQGIGDLDGDGAPDYECSDVVLHCPKWIAEQFTVWSPDQMRFGSLEFLDTRGRAMGKLAFSSLSISRMTVATSSGDYEVRINVSGPMRWMAPESLGR